ncbi:hypothetical protein ACWGQL_01510 [Streptomyces lydicus]
MNSSHEPTVAELRARLEAWVKAAPSGLGADMLQGFIHLLDEYRTEHSQAAGENLTEEGEDPLSRSYLRWVAKSYTRARDAAEQGDQAAHDRMLDQLADTLAEDLTLDDTRTLRVAAEAAVAATPRIVMRAAKRMQTPRIADEIGLTPSRVYGILREERRRLARAMIEEGINADEIARNDPRDSLDRYTAALADVPEEQREAAEQFLAGLRAAVEKHEREHTDEITQHAHKARTVYGKQQADDDSGDQ